MYIKGYSSNKPHVKSAKIDGGVAATFWPHGVSAIYETFSRMSMPWINNIPEVDFHGSNGNQVIGATPAADRYTEARLSKATEDGFLFNINKNPVPMILNFSEDEEWPKYFPAIFPRLAVNGSQGIGVAVAQTWMPMNLNELGEIIKGYIHSSSIDYSNCYLFDFPTKGMIINKNDLPAIHKTGKGSIKLRGTAEIKGKSILITDFPYQVYVEPFVDDVKKLIASEVITDIEEIHNKSDKKRLLVEIVCKTNPEKVLNLLYEKTDLQKSFSINQMALVNGNKTPQLLTLKDYLDVYIKHNLTCIYKEYEFDLRKAQDKLEIIQGLVKALAHIDDIINLIKSSDSTENAKSNLIKKYNFTMKQATAIVDMKLGKLAKLEGVELNKTEQGLLSDIENCNNILSNELKRKEILINRLDNFIKNYGFERRTKLEQMSEIKKEKVEQLPQACTISTDGKIIIRNSRERVKYPKVFTTDTSQKILVITQDGRMHLLATKDVPEAKTALSSFYNTNVVACETIDKTAKYLFCATEQGTVKKIPIEDIKNTKRDSTIIKLRDGDCLISCFFIKDEDIIIFADNGRYLRFRSTDFEPTSKTAIGVKGIGLEEGAIVVKAIPAKKPYYLFAMRNNRHILLQNKDINLSQRAKKGFLMAGATNIFNVDRTDTVTINKVNYRIEDMEYVPRS